MKTFKLVLLLLVLSVCRVYGGYVDTCRPNASGIFHKAFWDYAIKVLPDEYADGKYNVFVVKFYHLDSDQQDISFSISNIINKSEFDDIDANYYFDIGKELVMVYMPDTSFKHILKAIDFIPFEKYGKIADSAGIEIRGRLVNSDEGEYISRHFIYAEICSIRGCKLTKSFVGEIYDLPKPNSFFDLPDMPEPVMLYDPNHPEFYPYYYFLSEPLNRK